MIGLELASQLGLPTAPFCLTASSFALSRSMDVVDFTIFREMFPDGRGRFWGSRSIVDPRISAEEIAGRVHLSPSAVRARLRNLRSGGFLQGYEVWPSPRLFGCGLMTAIVPAKDTAHVDRIFDELRLVEGVVSAREMLGEEGRRVQVSYVSDAPESTARRTKLIVRLTAEGRMDPPGARWFPECTLDPSPLDWRTIKTLRSDPERPLPEAARALSVSLKTLTLHFHRLLDSHAILWVLKVDNALLSVGVYYIHLDGTRDRGDVESAVGARLPAWMPLAPGGAGEPPSERPPWIVGVFWLTSPSASRDVEQALLTVPGVVRVVRQFPGKAVNYAEWLDGKLRERLAEIGRPVRRPKMRSRAVSKAPIKG